MIRRHTTIFAALLVTGCVAQAEPLFDTAMMGAEGRTSLRLDGQSQEVRVASVSEHFFPDEPPVMWIGRAFVALDRSPSATPTTILTHPTWERLGALPGIVGSTVEVGGVDRVVVGVLVEAPEVEAQADVLIVR